MSRRPTDIFKNYAKVYEMAYNGSLPAPRADRNGLKLRIDAFSRALWNPVCRWMALFDSDAENICHGARTRQDLLDVVETMTFGQLNEEDTAFLAMTLRNKSVTAFLQNISRQPTMDMLISAEELTLFETKCVEMKKKLSQVLDVWQAMLGKGTREAERFSFHKKKHLAKARKAGLALGIDNGVAAVLAGVPLADVVGEIQPEA